MSYSNKLTLAQNREKARESKRAQRERDGVELTRAKWRAWYETNHEYRREYENSDENRKAKTKFNNARLWRGILIPENCSNCKRKIAVQAHHADYSKPMEVTWLCIDCHSTLHMLARNVPG